MPKNENHIRLVYDDRDYADLKLAAALDDSPNLKSWCARVLLDAARRTITQAKLKANQGDNPCSPS